VLIFLHEFVTGGGWYAHGPEPPPTSLTAEGRAMLQALAADFSAVSGTSVEVTRDVRLRQCALAGCAIHEVASRAGECQAIKRLSAAADWTVIIAPEFCGHLTERCRAVEQAGGRLLGPGSILVALASDKQATAEHLVSGGVSVPRGLALAPSEHWPAEFDYPAVLKPRDGAGSQGIERIATRPAGRTNCDTAMRLEAFCPGTAASVAVLCGPRQIVPLAPCLQRLDAASLAYLGGSLPIEPGLARRAARLAVQAIGTFDNPLGYIGVDLILGNAASGADDVVIEINPRITTSYVGLRALARGNLAASMIDVAEGREVELCWQSGPIQFEAAGDVR
jgi:hypothetical protein